jgi:cation transport regulator ChaB
MKKLILVSALLCLSTSAFAQHNFEWDVIDSCSKTKEQLYSDSKIFIANAFKSAQSVIQNDDKEGGNLIVKGQLSANGHWSGANYTFWYDCTITLMFKENRFRIKINNVSCNHGTFSNALASGSRVEGCIQPFESENYPYKMNKKGQLEVRDNLRKNIQNFVNVYILSMKSEVNSTTEDW